MDGEAFERVALENKDRLHGYASALLRDTGEAQDVTQEALIRLWNHRARVEPTLARAWLARTTHNLCIDRLRRRRTHPDTAGTPLEDDRAAAAPGPDRLSEADELGRLLRRELGRLSEDDRAVVVLREVQGLSYDEIAGVLGVPLGTLKARLYRARERLRERLVRAGIAP